MSGIFCMLISIPVMAQELPPRPIVVTVSTVQNLSFGAFAVVSTGGSVIIDPTGSRSYLGNIILLSGGFDFSAALFFIEANSGTQISVLKGSGTGGTLTGDNGGTMTVEVGDSYPLSPFVINVDPPTNTTVTVGGTLFVGDLTSNPAGNYSGYFYVTFVQE